MMPTDNMTLRDPLRFFRKHINLPFNTLGSNKKGTPRDVMKAGTYSELGGAHTSLVDCLHMRDVTIKAAYAVHRAFKTQSDIDIDDVHNKSDAEYYAALLATVFKKPDKSQVDSSAQTHGDPWMWTSFYWDGTTLRPGKSKEFKQKFVNWMQANGVEVTKNLRMAINAIHAVQPICRVHTRQVCIVGG